MRKIRLILSISIIILLANNSKGIAMAEKPDYKTEIREKFKQIDLSDGASKEEATIIAQNYIIEEGLDKKYILTKLDIEESGLEGNYYNYWKVTFDATYGETIKQANIFGLLGIIKWWISIRIDKKTGKIITVGGPDL